MHVGRDQMGHTKHGKKDRDQQSLVHRHIADPGRDGGPGIAGECSFVRCEELLYLRSHWIWLGQTA